MSEIVKPNLRESFNNDGKEELGIEEIKTYLCIANNQPISAYEIARMLKTKKKLIITRISRINKKLTNEEIIGLRAYSIKSLSTNFENNTELLSKSEREIFDLIFDKKYISSKELTQILNKKSKNIQATISHINQKLENCKIISSVHYSLVKKENKKQFMTQKFRSIVFKIFHNN